jgi:hypothetical protein
LRWVLPVLGLEMVEAFCLLESCGHRRCRQACGSGNASAADQEPAAAEFFAHGR